MRPALHTGPTWAIAYALASSAAARGATGLAACVHTCAPLQDADEFGGPSSKRGRQHGLSVMDVDAARLYRPKSRETREAYEALLAVIHQQFGEQPQVRAHTTHKGQGGGCFVLAAQRRTSDPAVAVGGWRCVR